MHAAGVVTIVAVVLIALALVYYLVSTILALRQITAGLTLSMDECMRMEFRILNRMLAGHDFYEGIRAAIIEKGSKPRWRPETLDAVRQEDVDAYFAPLPGGDLSL